MSFYTRRILRRDNSWCFESSCNRRCNEGLEHGDVVIIRKEKRDRT